MDITKLLDDVFTEVVASSELFIILQHPDKAVSLPIPGGHWRILQAVQAANQGVYVRHSTPILSLKSPAPIQCPQGRL